MPQQDRTVRSRQSGDRPVSITTYALDTVALTVLSHALASLLLIDESIPRNVHDQGSVLLQSLNTLVYVFYGLRLLLDPGAQHRLRCLAQRDRLFWLPLLALLAIALASSLWSGEPQVALRRAIAISGTCLVGLYLALRYTARQFLVLLLGLSAVFVVTSAAMVVLWPEKGIMQQSMMFEDVHDGRWRGIFLHKNHLGSCMAVGVVTAAGFLHGRGRQLFATTLILVLCMGVLLAAESLTALLATTAALLVVAALRIVARPANDRREALLGLAPVVLLGMLGALYQYAYTNVETAPAQPMSSQQAGAAPDDTTNPVAAGPSSAEAKPQREGFRRDASATGRFEIWRLCAQAIQLQPLHGYGYGTFWRNGGPAETVWQQAGFHMPHAHNGWLDLGLQLGLPTTLLIALWMLWLGVRLLRGVRDATDDTSRTTAITLLGLWCCLNVINLAETVLFREHELLTSLLVAVAVFVSGRAVRINQLAGGPATTVTCAQLPQATR